MLRLAFSFALALTLSPVTLAADPGVLPVGADGKPLNLDFETGDLRDWTATGTAFAGQPIKGDTVSPRRTDMKSRHQGEFWIGGWEKKHDAPQGTLTSASFKVTHPWASFLVGGGPYPNTAVELVRKDTGEVFYLASGLAEEDLRRVAVDLQSLQGIDIFIRIVDTRGGHWGHVNLDDFRFHSKKPEFAPRPESREPALTLTPDGFKHAGLSPEQSASAMTVPEGFKVTLFAGEPDVKQPIAMAIDDRGRLWIAEAYNYPKRAPEGQGKDRILIFEDADGDGKFDSRKVFMEGLNLVSGLEIGFGGVWIGAAPYLMFVPLDATGDKPAGPPKILLDGWAYEDTHETLNTFTWGPDGWLYGCHGVFTHSNVGKPGAAAADRRKINAGIWRYHPVKHQFEVFAHGTSNPWGMDFDEHGQLFCEACVIPHNWHIIQGGRYHRQAGSHFNPHTYADIQTIAEHRHYVGANPHGGNEISDSAGGGHAHCGTMIYQGGAWPKEYWGKMFMGNIHGRRLNVDKLTQKGSGFVATREPDFLLANDAWARFINIQTGPDGNAYLFDWYDAQACHDNKPEIWDRTNGRIYKVSYKGTNAVVGLDLAKYSDAELIGLQLSDNDWYARHARRILQERAAGPVQINRPPQAGRNQKRALDQILGHPDATRRLRGLWTLNAIGGENHAIALMFLNDRNSFVRGWAIQLALENQKTSAIVPVMLADLADGDPSPIVRLYLASACQRLPLDERWAILNKLVQHVDDANDHNLPMMYWYAAEPLAELDPDRAMHLASHAKGQLLTLMTQCIASINKPESLSVIVSRLWRTDDSASQLLILEGLRLGLQGRRMVPMPRGWTDVYAKLSDNAELRDKATALAVKFGDATAWSALRQVVSGSDTGAKRHAALSALIDVHDPQLPPLLLKLLADATLRAPAIRGLANYDDPATPAALLAIYATLGPAEKRDAVATLAARLPYAKALIEAVAANKIPAGEVPADIVRQLRTMKDADLDRRISEVWGVARAAADDRVKEIARYRTLIANKLLPKPDVQLGRAIHAKTCQQCHTLFGIGRTVGPDITGANRADIVYLLENSIDPSAIIPKEYTMSVLNLADGRFLTGIIKSETPTAVVFATATESLTIPKNEIENRATSETSMMPENQLKPMSDHEVRSLFAYLQLPNQVPLLATQENAKDFFNGKDLTGWDGDAKLWSVGNGEIVGKSPGIKRNEFLKSHMTADDFRFTVKVKLTPNKENSGIQFRSEPLASGEMKGYQADIGAGWWGKLYEESGRGLLSDKSGEKFVKPEDWNEYVIEAVGSRVRTWINGNLCVDRDDPAAARRGIFGLQIHSGGAMEVRFKDLKLEVIRR